MQAKPCVHTKKEHLASRFRRVWSNQSAIFPFIDRGHLRVLLRHRTPEKAHELFNLLFLSILSIEGILRYEVSEYSRKHEQFFKSWTVFWKLCTLLKKTQTKYEREHLLKFTNIFWKHQLFFYKNMNIIWICEHFFKTGTCVENS